jgi:hypothetical protein
MPYIIGLVLLALFFCCLMCLCWCIDEAAKDVFVPESQRETEQKEAEL